MGADGTWTASVTIPEPGRYRVFADFKHDGTNQTLARDLTVAGAADHAPPPAPATTAVTDAGHRVELEVARPRAGEPAELTFQVSRDGEEAALEDYLGAKGHLVALRAADLAYLHTHPTDGRGHAGGEAVSFESEFPSEGRYRLFLQFRHDGEVHTAAFTMSVAR